MPAVSFIDVPHDEDFVSLAQLLCNSYASDACIAVSRATQGEADEPSWFRVTVTVRQDETERTVSSTSRVASLALKSGISAAYFDQMAPWTVSRSA